MKLYAYHTELYEKFLMNAEYSAYLALTRKPLQKDINYLAVAWVPLLNLDKLDLAPAINLKGGFTICEHAKYKKVIPIVKRIGVDTLFTPHGEAGHVGGVRIMPFPHYVTVSADPALDKDLLYSFIGYDSTTSVNCPLRRQIFNMDHLPDTVVKERRAWHWAREFKWADLSEQEQAKEEAEYKEVLSRSRFSLCPRGVGPSTLRFWESLKALAIPVLLSDAFRLPEGVRWDECIVRIREKDALKIGQIIRAIPEAREAEMRHKCLEAYKAFSGDNIVSGVRRTYGEAP